MASTGSVSYIRPVATGGGAKSGFTGSIAYVVPRATSGLWSSSGVVASADTAGALTWLPHSRQPIGWVTIGGQRYPVEGDPHWYRYHNTVAEVKLGGINGATVADVATAVDATVATAAAAEASVAALSVQTQTNAAAAYVMRNVIKQADLGGSDQIPEVGL